MHVNPKYVALALAATIGVAIPATAHHSPASYDLTKRSSVTGVVKIASFRNPHGHMVLQVAGKGGKMTEWQVETSAANLLRRRGWVFSDIKPGMKITVTGHLNKTVPNDIYIREVKLPDGRQFGDKGGNDVALD